MKRRKQVFSITLILTLIVGMLAPASQAQAAPEDVGDLFISEYIEGSSYNKAVEIYNGTDEAVDLANYSLELYSNGQQEPGQTESLSGELPAGEVVVISHSQAGSDIHEKTDITSHVTNFNGDDVLVLKHDGDVIDSFGQIGTDEDFAKDTTFVREWSISSGDTNPEDEFDDSGWEILAKDTFTYLGSYSEGETAPDEPIEQQTISEVRNGAEDGDVVKVTGTATASFDSGGQTNLYIQDDTAGIIVRASGMDAEVGDEVMAQGEYSPYYGMAQILSSNANVTITTEDKGVPDPVSVSAEDFQAESGEDIEGEFAEASNVTIKSVNQHGDFTAEDEAGTFKITPQDDSLLEVGETYEHIKGVVNYSYEEYKLVPRDSRDVIDTVFSVNATPDEGDVQPGTHVELYTEQEDASIHYTTDGTEPSEASPEYQDPIELTQDTVIKAVVVKSNGETSDVSAFSYTMLKPVDELKIHDIQGASHISPYEGIAVEDVTGIVTKRDGSNGFYMQDPDPDGDPATSEGIYVYNPNGEVSPGDQVSVAGDVTEYREDGYDDANDLLTTQISATDVEVEQSDQSLPDPIVIGKDRSQPTETIEDDGMESFDPKTDGLDFYESLEGMMIALENPTVVSPPKYDEVAVFVETSPNQLRSEAGGLLISPNDYNPERMLIDVEGKGVNVKTGDAFDGTITGVVNYDYSNYKIRPIGDLPATEDGGTERDVTDIEANEDELSIASYNVENFSAETDEEKVNKIAESVTQNLKTPDIIGLIEVQDNNGATDDGTVSADESYQTLIEAIEANGGPTYEFTDIAPEDKMDGGQPGGNIRVGFIYNPERVSLAEKEAGDATTAVGVEEEGLTLNPGRIDPTNEAFNDSRKSLAAEFEFKGEDVVVVANHFNSKGGDDALFGADHPIELGSEVQRLKQAEVINGFVNDVENTMKDANVVVLGDLNDFEFSDPVNTLEGDVLTNMIEELPKEERYSYIYQGNSQVLDHILVSKHMKEQTKIDSVNINADFSEADGRASDHDPILAQIQFEEESKHPDLPDWLKWLLHKLNIPWDKLKDWPIFNFPPFKP
ncbi:chitobiase/beta-hexosaminidase C-terminal domain-containing protein [Thalassobacillus sp. CUG 92003]|uniref:chitobiase/beta-hexosaminidase C-terminal domain-containing protein n=1 Tax=Thalassobacillus sp. CUG 92003 TaxID=2736641 RepID=UPI00351AA48F